MIGGVRKRICSSVICLRVLGQFRYNLGWLLIFLRNLTRLLTRAAATVISEQFGMLTVIFEQPALVSRFISEQPRVVPGVCVQLLAVNIPAQPGAAAAVIS